MVTAERVRELLNYDPLTGVFRWRVDIIGGKGAVRVRPGTVAGTPHKEGYVKITISKRGYLAHRLACLYVTGEWPPHDIDHRDRDRANNRWRNLRPATRTQNNANSKRHDCNVVGFKGVRRHKNRFAAQIRANGKTRHLGLFLTPEDAHAAYVAAAQQLHGEFARAA